MFAIIGIVVVIGAIVGGYLMEHGNLRVLIQPAELLIIGGAAIGKLPNKIHVEGHTDSKSYAENSNYTNWELSVDRANAARKITQQHGLRRPGDPGARVRGSERAGSRRPARSGKSENLADCSIPHQGAR